MGASAGGGGEMQAKSLYKFSGGMDGDDLKDCTRSQGKEVVLDKGTGCRKPNLLHGFLGTCAESQLRSVFKSDFKAWIWNPERNKNGFVTKS